ncbi:MAG TPA: ATP-binding cassette domain-containing protein [Planctomycetota bacterium]|nr:ATP-binding cassette domain-containing protein [Planctomycetota bacterium]
MNALVRTSDPDSVLELDGAERRRAGAPVIGPVALRLRRGGVCALLGPSGSGKSTVLALLAGVESADAGRVLWQGRDVTRASESSLALLRRGRIGIVGQGFSLHEHLPVWQAVSIGLVPLGVERAARRARAVELLETLAIPARLAARMPAELSGGERQRAALARALLCAEVALIADEPTSNQDPASAELVVSALLAHAARGVALAVATHDPRLEKAADQQIRLTLPRALP